LTAVLVMLDAGGVLFNNITEDSPFFDRLAHRCGVHPGGLRQAYAAREDAVETGCTTGSDAVLAALTELGGSTGDLSPERVRRWYGECVRPDRRLLTRLAERRAAGASGVRITLADNEAYDWEMVKHSMTRHLTLVDSLSSSWLLGLSKPEPAYFTAVLDRHRVGAAEALLVDDNPVCLDAARGLGIATHHYRDPEALLRLLAAI
jgi:putative hydrolase of the HAD superfamily